MAITSRTLKRRIKRGKQKLPHGYQIVALKRVPKKKKAATKRKTATKRKRKSKAPNWKNAFTF